MTRQPGLLFALSLSLASLGLVAGAHAADKGPGACCVNVLDMSRVDYSGAGKVNVGDGFVANNRDDAPARKTRNLGSLSGIGSTNELGRAGLAGGSGNPSAPGFAGGVRVAVGDVDGASAPQGAPQGTSGRIGGIAVDPSDPSGNTAGGASASGASAGERHFNGVVNRIAQGRADDAGDGNTTYVSTAGGGAWKTKDGGQTWTPQQGQGVAGGTGALESLSGNNTWAGNAPGAPSGAQDSYYGTGIYKSTDGGQTWQQGNNGHNTGALRSLNNGNAAAAGGANGGVWKTTNFLTATPSTGGAGATDSRPGAGVLKSMDGGRTFNQPVVTQGLKVK